MNIETAKEGVKLVQAAGFYNVHYRYVGGRRGWGIRYMIPGVKRAHAIKTNMVAVKRAIREYRYHQEIGTPQ